MATHIEAMQPRVTFAVSRPCADGRCPEGTWRCSCQDGYGCGVYVEELTASELSYYEHEGSDAQRCEMRAYLDEERDADGEAVAMAA